MAAVVVLTVSWICLEAGEVWRRWIRRSQPFGDQAPQANESRNDIQHDEIQVESSVQDSWRTTRMKGLACKRGWQAGPGFRRRSSGGFPAQQESSP